MADEREKRKMRPHAQRLKRVHADTRGEDEQEVPLDSLRERISALKDRHQQLRQALSKPEKLQGVKLAQEFEEARANSPAGQPLPETSWNDVFLETVFELAHSPEKENMAGRLLYHIGRKTIFILSHKRVGVQFAPAFGDQLQESYFCVLSIKPPTDKVVVSKDNIPFFLPLRELEKTYLQLSATSFIDQLDNHLQAFVSRRGQIHALQELYGDSIGDLYYSLPYNLIKFSLEDPSCSKAEVELAFDDLESEHPTRAIVQVWLLSQEDPRASVRRHSVRGYQPCPQVTSRRVPRAEEMLITRLLPEVYVDLIREIQAAATSSATVE